MKHNLKITSIILAMFLLTQFIGIYVVNFYSPESVVLPFGLDPPQPDQASEYTSLFSSIVFAFVLAIALLFAFMKLKLEWVLKAWFFIVIALSLSIAFFVFTSQTNIERIYFEIPLVATLIAIPLTILKMSGKSLMVHNLTEFLIYPGIAAVFVPLLSVWTLVALLIIISVYDAWAVWHSGIMQKMAKYQINTLKVFSGFFVPYMSSKMRKQVNKWKQSMSKSQLSKKKIKVNVAILGGGDIVFPIIASGVMLKTLGLTSAIFVVIGAALGLLYLLTQGKKKKFYPAMPFISAGIFLGILASYLIL